MSGRYNRKDRLYRKAKEEGFQSRAAYKLVEVQKKYKLLKSGAKVLDLGCWPGGWLQVASELVGDRGTVVGLDLAECEISISNNVKTLIGNANDPEALARCMELAGALFDVVLSDMSPKLSGIREVDQAASVECAQMARAACKTCLRGKGSLVIKLFKGPSSDEFVRDLKGEFVKLHRCELDATRSTSNEFYIVALEFKKVITKDP